MNQNTLEQIPEVNEAAPSLAVAEQVDPTAEMYQRLLTRSEEQLRDAVVALHAGRNTEDERNVARASLAQYGTS